MPFGRPARSNNRSQHNLVESAGIAAANTTVTGPGSSSSSGQGIPTPSSASTGVGAGAGAGGPPGQPRQVQPQGQTGGQRQGPSSSALDPSKTTASFVQDPRAANQPLPPHNLYTSSTPVSASGSGSGSGSTSASGDPYSSVQQLHALNTANLNSSANVVPDARVSKAAYDFRDAVGRSRSQRTHQVATPIQPNLSYGASYEDLTTPFNYQQQQQQPIAYQNHLQQQQQQGPPVESRRSTRRLIKNILAGTNNPSKADQNRDDGGFIQQQGQIHIQTQLNPDQQQRIGQVAFDPATRQYQFITRSPQRQVQAEGNQPAYSSNLSAEQHRNPETISQLSHDSPANDGEHHASSSNVQSTAASPAVRYSANLQDLPARTSSLQPFPQQSVPQPQQQQQQETAHQQEQHQPTMAPPGGGPQTRGSQDTEKSLRGSSESHTGAPPSYRHSQHSQQPSSNMNPLPAVPQSAQGQNPNYRPSSLQAREQFDGAAEQGRNSPQPSEDPEKAFKDLLTKYKNVKRLYFDGKTQIEQLSGQVEQLQDAVANQRITQSRTALDDNEYTTRFNRLNGAINNLSFNIRKDWVSLPAWLEKFVSADALKTGKQEMTAVGRAVITGWLVENIFHGCFHPGLEPALSKQLKEIEQNIRRNCYTLNSQEEFDALTSKVVGWRMTTLDGLQNILQSEESANNRQEFIHKVTEDLVKYLFDHLTDPPPAGVDGSVSMIVELAVGIAANLPLESRDVAVIYPLPQDNIQPNIMEVEKAPLPAIETRPADGDGDADSRGEDNGKDSGGEKSGSSKERNKSRTGMSTTSTLSNLLSNASSALVPGSGNSRKGSVASTSQQSPLARKQSNATSLTDSTTNLALPPKDSNKVRFAGFLAVEVRGRHVLVKAPVWTLG
ncbi:hypothetical protein SLS53_007057 [Cytospora paraplurivora]|uniref:S-adenosylmethionine-dependent methyltransferase-like protein n=1 Tax=Cytospora paraplurivora TaxID=2898453 RepID=A0AAN9U479_9PEZI